MKKSILAALVLMSSIGSANATTSTFAENAVNVQQSSTFASGELSFTPDAPYVYTYNSDGGWGTNNNTNHIIAGWGSGVGSFSFAETNGSNFSLSAIDISSSYYGNGTSTAQFVGHQVGGGTLTQSFAVGSNYQTYNFSNWTNLTSVNVLANTQYGYIGYDNVNVAAVPEPEEWAMMALGLGLIGFKLRNRESQDSEKILAILAC